jgi:acetate kinase
MSRLLVLNAGSSSLKFKLFSLNPLTPTVGGLVERIGDAACSNLVAKAGGSRFQEQSPMRDHVSAMERIMRFLSDTVSPDMAREVVAVGHRVVHGLDMHRAALLGGDVLAKIRTAAALAPLHNPPGLQGIQAAQAVFKGVPQVGSCACCRRAR